MEGSADGLTLVLGFHDLFCCKHVLAIALHRGEIKPPEDMDVELNTKFSDNGGKRSAGRPPGSGKRMVPVSAFSWGAGSAKSKKRKATKTNAKQTKAKKTKAKSAVKPTPALAVTAPVPPV